MTNRIATTVFAVMAATPVWAGQNGLADLGVKPAVYSYEGSATYYVVFGPAAHLTMDVRLGNEDSSRTLIVQPGFFENIRWTLEAPRSDASKPVAFEPIVLSAQRIEGLTCGPEPAAACDALSKTLVNPEGWVTARLVLRPKTGVVGAGEYRLTVNAGPARQGLREADESSWKGRFVERGSIALVVRALSTPEAQAQYYAAEAAEAMRSRDYTTALSYYQRMAAATPGEAAGESGVGSALLELGRFGEAAATLERVWVRHRTRFAASQLAVAYAALGRDSDANTLVKQLYPPEQVIEAMERVRMSARTLTSRRR